MSSVSRIIVVVSSAALALLDRVDIRDRFVSLSCTSGAFRFGDRGDTVTGGVLANCIIAGRDFVNASTASLIAQFPRSFDSWSEARHSGHLPSTARLLRMQSEQNVWLQEVNMGELKKSLHTWQRKACSTGMRLARGVPSQSVESGTSNDSSILETTETSLQHQQVSCVSQHAFGFSEADLDGGVTSQGFRGKKPFRSVLKALPFQ